MIRNHFITAFRSLGRSKIFTAINIAGLTIGISASLVIYLIVHYEFSFETFWPNKDRIYRVVTNMHFPNQDFKNGGVPGPLPTVVKQDIPEIEKSTFFVLAGNKKVSIETDTDNPKTFKHQNEIILANDDYFSFLNYQWIAGSPTNALDTPGKVVLTESRAKTYFPYTDISRAMGQTIVYNDTVNAIVTGIVKDRNEVTDFTFKEFISFSTYEQQLKNSGGLGEWGSVSSDWQYFVLLKKGTNPHKIDEQLADLRKKYQKNAYLPTDHFLQPLEDIHFNPEFDSMNHRKAHKPTLYGLLAVASFLLLLGCINFINLNTAQGAHRAKEIGIRKTLGSSKKHLVFQFLSETLVLTVMASLLSLALIPLILKIFSGFIPEGLTFHMGSQPNVFIFLTLLIIIVSLLSGFYPAIVLSKYKPVTVLKNVAYANSSQSRRIWVRKTLTVSQFVIAQFFIIATVIVGKQIQFALHKDMGFKKDAIITFTTPFNFQNPDGKQFVLQQELKGIPGIAQLSLAGSPPASNSTNSSTMKFTHNGKEIETTVEVKQADTNYFKLYHMKVIAGRQMHQSDTVREYVINEKYAHFLGFQNPADIVGQYIMRNKTKIPIVGVLADINTKSVQSAIQPLVYTSQAKYHHTFHVALPISGNASMGWDKTIHTIESKFKQVYPEDDFSYTFFDEDIANFYKSEQNTSKLLGWSTGLAIFISCLGLLGLVIYTTTQRTKEIGVRKVLGASVSQIVALLSKDFIQLVVVAFLIAAPLAWWAMHKWLEDYAYRTGISFWIFLWCGLFMIVMALLTMSVQTIRSAIANPVKSLRTE